MKVIAQHEAPKILYLYICVYGYISGYGFYLSLYLKELQQNIYCCNTVFVAFYYAYVHSWWYNNHHSASIYPPANSVFQPSVNKSLASRKAIGKDQQQ